MDWASFWAIFSQKHLVILPSAQVRRRSRSIMLGEHSLLCSRSLPSFSVGWSEQGCQIFLDTLYQNGENYTKLPQNYQMTLQCKKQMAIIYSYIPNGHNIFLLGIKCSNFFWRPPKFNHIGIFCFENIPSGNPGSESAPRAWSSDVGLDLRFVSLLSSEVGPDAVCLSFIVNKILVTEYARPVAG
jgi:hypothetical protein